MSEAMLNKINNIPVRTWRWLGVNNTTIDDIMPELTPYTLDSIIENTLIENTSSVSILAMNQVKHLLPIADFLDYDGISKDLSLQVMDSYNTGFYVETDPYQKTKDPLRIHYNADNENRTIVDNNLIIARENSEVTLVVDYTSKDNVKAYHNGLTRIYCEKGASVTLVKIQSLSDESIHLDACIAKTEENAKVNYILIELGSKNSITNVRTDLKGQKSSVEMHTVYLGDKERTIDINYLINHIGKETNSNIEAKGALLDQCKKTFKGTIDLKKGASKANGKEEEYAVLLSKDVRNRSVPVLLCTEDDVSGQHAASTGKVDENKLFYLMTRGFSEAEAKKLIIEAAISPIIDLIPEQSMRTAVYEEVRRKIINE